MQDLPKINVGDSFEVFKSQQVHVKNPDGIRNDANVFYGFNELAWIMKGSKLTILVMDGDQVLVKYEKQKGQLCRGNEAASGTLFLESYWKFLKMTTCSLEKTWDTYENEYVRRLLKTVE